MTMHTDDMSDSQGEEQPKSMLQMQISLAFSSSSSEQDEASDGDESIDEAAWLDRELQGTELHDGTSPPPGYVLVDAKAHHCRLCRAPYGERKGAPSDGRDDAPRQDDDIYFTPRFYYRNPAPSHSAATQMVSIPPFGNMRYVVDPIRIPAEFSLAALSTADPFAEAPTDMAETADHTPKRSASPLSASTKRRRLDQRVKDGAVRAAVERVEQSIRTRTSRPPPTGSSLRRRLLHHWAQYDTQGRGRETRDQVSSLMAERTERTVQAEPAASATQDDASRRHDEWDAQRVEEVIEANVVEAEREAQSVKLKSYGTSACDVTFLPLHVVAAAASVLARDEDTVTSASVIDTSMVAAQSHRRDIIIADADASASDEEGQL